MAFFDRPKGEKSPSGGSSDPSDSKALALNTGNPPPSGEPEEEEDGMLRMSFLGHLEELRRRIFLMLIGVAVAFFLSLTFCNPLWKVVAEPATDALTALGIDPPNLVAITPMEQFNVIWFKLPTLVAVFLSSPWIFYQIWAFISPGLYKKERRFAAPFILFSAGLFIAGGCFAYFVAFRFGITFLLGVGRDVGVTPMVSITEYFDLFVDVMLGIGLVFELPVIIFFLTLIRVVSPKFLIAHSRYAILAIVVVAAVVTPTPDIFNLLLFAVPMCMLFYVGIFASYILVLKREGRKLPWTMILGIVALILALLAGAAVLAIKVMHFHVIPAWPFLTK